MKKTLTLDSSTSSESFSRRKFLATTAAATASWLISPPAVHASRREVTLRVLGTNVTLQEDIRRQAEKDLGFKIQFEPKGSAGVLQKASTRPESFDVYEQWSNSMNVLWQANAIQPIDKSRIRRAGIRLTHSRKTGQLTTDMKK
ncbi:MAG: twin-arginine translocation signal domain-containing protein [Planctomycetaceae bacterium]